MAENADVKFMFQIDLVHNGHLQAILLFYSLALLPNLIQKSNSMPVLDLTEKTLKPFKLGVTITPCIFATVCPFITFQGDLEDIRLHFSDMIRKSLPIRKQNVKEAFEKEQWGNNLLKKVTLDTIFNRIKYERRVHRSSK